MLSLDAALSASLNRAAREQALTLNTVMQAAWGILLGRLSGRDDVVFGVTVAGRPAELAGVEHMVGLFINTLPLRLQLPPELPLSALLRQTQDSQSRLMAHQHLGLAEIQQAAGVGDLFDTLLVFENYPVDRAGLAAAGLGTTGNGLKLGQVQGRDATHYPLALIVQPGETLQLRLDYRPDLFERADVEAIGRRLIRLLEAAVADAGQPLGSLPILDDRRARHHPAQLERHGAAGSAADPAGAVCRAGRAHAGRGRGGVRGPHAHLRRARRPRQPAGASSAKPRASARMCWSGLCAERSLETGGGIARQSSRPAAPTCRSIRSIRPSGSPTWWRMRACGWCCCSGAAVDALPLHGRRDRASCSSWMTPSDRRSARAAAERAGARRSACRSSGLHDLHLGLDRQAQGRGQHPCGSAQPPGLDAGRLWADGDDVVLQKTPFSFDVSVWEFFWPLMSGRGWWWRRRARIAIRRGSSRRSGARA